MLALFIGGIKMSHRLNHKILFRVNKEVSDVLKKIALPYNQTEIHRSLFLLGVQTYINSISKGFTPILDEFKASKLRKLHFIIPEEVEKSLKKPKLTM